jgi:anti-sigma-K factor RskA
VEPALNHADYEQLAAGFALGALEPDDEQVFQRHLEGCPTCRASLREHDELVASLAYAAPVAEPPAALRAAIRRRTGHTARRRVLRAVGSWSGSRVALRVAVVVGIVGLFALSLWNLALREQHELDRFRMGNLEAALRMLNDLGAQPVRLSGPANAQGARATVVASSPQDRGVLVVEGLPQLPQDRVYELWSLPQGDVAQATRALAFSFRSGRGVRAIRFSVPIQPSTAFAITDEAGPRGSDHPTGPPILAGAPPPQTARDST